MTPSGPTIRPTGTAQVLGAALGALFVVRLGLAWWQGQGGSLPIPSYPAWASIVLITVGIAWLAHTTRRLIARDRTLLDPEQAVTRLLLGKTSQVGGALLFGTYGALAWAAAGALPAPLAIERVIHAGIAVPACVAWVVAGRALEAACRVPDDEGGDDSPDTPSGDGASPN
ncbi:MAG TPA: DUF3180 domain-containing protein [Actinomycetales bacterium]|nr:DUF3180 domain-containing protein [Actinomycetales bacterium]